MTSPLAQIMVQVNALQSRLNALETTNQLEHSSLDNASLPVKDGDGNVTAIVGRQTDGTYAYNVVDGPVPPMPTGITAVGGAGTLTVTWDGTFTYGAAAPADLAVVVIHVGTSADFEATSGNAVVALTTAEPTRRALPLGAGTVYVRATTVALSGRRSEATEPVEVVVFPLATDSSISDALAAEAELREQSLADAQAALDELDEKIDGIEVGGGAGITTSDTDPTEDTPGTTVGEVWWTAPDDGPITAQWEWSGTEWIKRDVSSEAITNLDVSKLTATSADLGSAVVNKLWANIFTAKKITGEEIAAGSITGEHISANSISADKISGGSFEGETFTGGSFNGARLSTLQGPDDEVGVIIADDAGPGVVGNPRNSPGIRFHATSIADTAKMASITSSPNSNGKYYDGGLDLITAETAEKYRGRLQIQPDNFSLDFSKDKMPQVSMFTRGSMLQTTAYTTDYTGSITGTPITTGGWARTEVYGGKLWATITHEASKRLNNGILETSKLEMQSGSTNGKIGLSHKDDTDSESILMGVQQGVLKLEAAKNDGTGSGRIIVNSSGGVWAHSTDPSTGITKSRNLTEDTGWITTGLYFRPGWSMPTYNIGNWEPLRYRIMNGMCYISGFLIKSSTSTIGETMCTLPVNARPGKFWDFPGRGQFKTNGDICCSEASTATAVSFHFPIG